MLSCVPPVLQETLLEQGRAGALRPARGEASGRRAAPVGGGDAGTVAHPQGPPQTALTSRLTCARRSPQPAWPRLLTLRLSGPRRLFCVTLGIFPDVASVTAPEGDPSPVHVAIGGRGCACRGRAGNLATHVLCLARVEMPVPSRSVTAESG